MQSVHVISGSREGETVELAEGDEVLLGRDSACHLDLGDPKASRRHCVLRCRDGGLEVEDLRSSNGTWVNGEEVRRCRLEPGDVLRVGDSVLELVGDETGSEDDAGRPASAAAAAAAREPDEGSPRPSVLRRRFRRLAPLLIFLVVGGGLAAALHAFLSDRRSTEGVATRREAGLERAGGATDDRATGDGAASPVEASEGLRAVGEEGADVPPRRRDGATAPESSPAVVAPRGPHPAAAGREEVAADDFRGQLRELEARSGELTPAAFRKEARRVLATARDHLDETVDTARDLVRRGDYGGGRLLVLDLLPRLPEMLQRPALAELERLGELERERREGGGITPDDPTLAVKAAIAGCRFAEAERLAARLDTSGSGQPGEALEAEARSAGAAWRCLQSALGALAADAATVRLEWEPRRARVVLEGGVFRRGAPPPHGEYTVLAIENTRVRLRGTGGERLEDVFTLEDATLLRILELGKPEAAAKKDLLRGLGLLLLYREGPRRARDFAGAVSPGGDDRPWFLEKAETERETWLFIRRRELESGAARLHDKSAPGELSHELARRAAELLVLWRERPSFSGARAGLIELYRDVRGDSLERGGTADGAGSAFFRAGEVEMTEGHIRLRYDFTSRSQLEDFLPMGEESRRNISRRRLALRGECRVLEGRPFASPLAVRLRLPGNGYSPSAPNINVGLWTSENVAVSPRGTFTLTRSLLTGSSGEAGYIVCATGYRTTVSDYGGKKLEEVRPRGSKGFVPLPAHVLFAGLPGQPLHTEPAECVWARAIGPSGLRGPLAIDIAAGETLEWKINGRPVVPEETAALARLRLPERRAGSVSIFTCGHELKIDELEIEGALNAGWLDARITERVEEEIRRLLQ